MGEHEKEEEERPINSIMASKRHNNVALDTIPARVLIC